MEFYDEKDMEYWRKQADLGKAVILEIPISMLLDLDIRSLSEKQGEKTSMDGLDAWLSRNRDDLEKALEYEKKEKKAVEMLEESLYDGSNSEKKKDESDHSKQTELSDAAAKVSRIMATETFSEDQIAVIAEAMLEKLPDRFLLLFMRKEYSPKVMRQIKDYCTGQYQKEVSGNNEGKQEMDPADPEPSAVYAEIDKAAPESEIETEEFYEEGTYEMTYEYERVGTIYDDCKTDWNDLAQSQILFFRNAPQHIIDLQCDLESTDIAIEEALSAIEDASYNVAQGFKVYKELKELRNKRRQILLELNYVQTIAERFDCGAMLQIYEEIMADMILEESAPRQELTMECCLRPADNDSVKENPEENPVTAVS